LRRFATISVSAAVFIGAAVSVANPAATASGRLAGKTQISFGCPAAHDRTAVLQPLAPFRSRPFLPCTACIRRRPDLGNTPRRHVRCAWSLRASFVRW
jgi:hypothetical protein